MMPKRPWHEWLEALIAQHGTARACAESLWIDESKLSRWRRPYFQEPTARDLEILAEKTKTPLPDLLLMVWAALRARDAFRVDPQMGTAAPSVVPSPKPPRRGRRKLAAVAFGLLSIGSGSALADPLPVPSRGDGLPLIGHWRRRFLSGFCPIAALPIQEWA